MEEKKELKYPVKYAIMPIVEQVGWYPGLNDLEPEYSVVANIVSKCYVIGEKNEYLSNGEFLIKYEVVFPVIPANSRHNKNFVKVVPEYSHDLQCTNSVFVRELFGSFEEAKKKAELANNEIVFYELALSYNENLQRKLKVIKEHQNKLDKYKNIEAAIEKELAEMKVSQIKNTNLETLIAKIVENPREFYIKLAYALSIEEREYLKQVIEGKSCLNCSNDRCNKELCEKAQENNCLSWNNPELIGKQRVLMKEVNI